MLSEKSAVLLAPSVIWPTRVCELVKNTPSVSRGVPPPAPLPAQAA